jgi:hypothetical protein
MKKSIRLALISAAMGAPAFAAPFMAIGDGAELFVTGTLGLRSDDNIFLASGLPLNPARAASATNPVQEEVDDVIFDINPGVDITFGKNSQLQGNLSLVVAFANYSDNSNLNTTLFAGNFASKYDDGKLKLGFNLGYNELNQNSVDILGLTRRDVFNAGSNAEVEISQITSVGGAIEFRTENYKRAAYSDTDTLSIPLNFYYQLSEKVDLSLGYRYRDTQVSIGRDSTDQFFSVGARGEFSPKFTGTFAIGLNNRDIDRGGSDNQLGLDANFAYEVSPKTSLTFGASNDFGTSPQGAQQKNLTFNAGIVSKLTAEFALNTGINWRAIDYGTRTDDYFEWQLGGAYTVNANVSIVGGYTYRNYSSDLAGSEFKNNVFSVSANFRY